MQELKEIVFFMYEHWCITTLFLVIFCTRGVITIK